VSALPSWYLQDMENTISFRLRVGGGALQLSFTRLWRLLTLFSRSAAGPAYNFYTTDLWIRSYLIRAVSPVSLTIRYPRTLQCALKPYQCQDGWSDLKSRKLQP
jgi:hypothetical protein